MMPLKVCLIPHKTWYKFLYKVPCENCVSYCFCSKIKVYVLEGRSDSFTRPQSMNRVKICCRSLKTSGILDVDPRTAPQLRLDFFNNNLWLEAVTYCHKELHLRYQKILESIFCTYFSKLSIFRFEERINKTEAKNNKLLKSIINIFACLRSIWL